MGDHPIAAGHGVGNQVVVSDLKKGVDGRWLVVLTVRPIRYFPKRLEHRRRRREEEALAALLSPLGESVISGLDLVEVLSKGV